MGSPVLALDVAGNCGWAVTPRVSGVWDIKPRRGDSPGMRYIYLRKKLSSVLKAYPDLSLVVYERAHHRGGAATEYALGYSAIIQSWCAEKKIEHQAVHSSEIKREATGRGSASKADMIAAAKIKWPKINVISDDHADALWLLHYATKEG